MERLTDEEFETIKKLALETAQVTVMSQRSMYEVIKSLCSLMLDGKKLAAYEDIGTPEEIADHEEMFEAYRHVCRGKSPEEVYGIFAEHAAFTQAKAEGRLLPHEPSLVLQEFSKEDRCWFRTYIVEVTQNEAERYIDMEAEAALEAQEGE
ncbi:MAG: hypothetical protein VB081_10095 [Christensenella sp.]|uniref:hypothetical protein n=1 Tax=Christensenella sp. TaxID=1935934 RepID=UPI002B1EA137|nr:hypothetical protein [Christensenella sp.]MEA5003837.1 hypothetical protein [Christensenella sp.]